VPSSRRRAPAKVNLGLRILGRRSDGMHLLESVFLPLDLCDEVEVSLATPGCFRIELEGCGAGVPADDRNLALRAARGFCRRAGLGDGAVVRLHKRIPVAAGLGGGSSDAAAVLRGLDALRPGILSAQERFALALELGADVPYFLEPQPALVEGVGERVCPLAGVPSFALLLVYPGTRVPTPAVYERFDQLSASLTPAGAGSTLRALLALRDTPEGMRSSALEGLAAAGSPADRAERIAGQLAAMLRNDLEAAAVALCPAVAEEREEIEATGALAVGMSGSGPTLFGVYEDSQRAQRALRHWRERREGLAPGPRSWVVVTRGSRT